MAWDAIAGFLGPAYLRYSFTRSTELEVDFLVEALGLAPGQRVLDVGCGPGRHAHALSARGMRVVGVDRAEAFLRLAASPSRNSAVTAPAPPPTEPLAAAPTRLGPHPQPPPEVGAPTPARAVARFARGDARGLPVRPGSFDAVVCLCQGGFGLLGGGMGEALALAQMAGALSGGGHLALSAFSAYFAIRYLEEGETFDADGGVHHERSPMRNETGRQATFDLWTTCFTPRELRLLCASVGLEVRHLWSVGPGSWQRRRPDLEHPEWLLVAARP